MNLKRGILFGLILVFALSGGFMFIQAGDEMTVEANFIGYGVETIMIEVPDYIFLGQVSKNDPISSEEPNIEINNTGNVDVTVTPSLISGSPEVFNYLFFRFYKTHNSTAVTPTPLNEFSVDIDSYDDEKFYMSMNLTEFDGILDSDNLNLSATVKFTAMAS